MDPSFSSEKNGSSLPGIEMGCDLTNGNLCPNFQAGRKGGKRTLPASAISQFPSLKIILVPSGIFWVAYSDHLQVHRNKNTTKRIMLQVSEWKKIFAVHTSIKGFTQNI